jgi:hypothetical protein
MGIGSGAMCLVLSDYAVEAYRTLEVLVALLYHMCLLYMNHLSVAVLWGLSLLHLLCLNFRCLLLCVCLVRWVWGWIGFVWIAGWLDISILIALLDEASEVLSYLRDNHSCIILRLK